jgi:hypothetical protein
MGRMYHPQEEDPDRDGETRLGMTPEEFDRFVRAVAEEAIRKESGQGDAPHAPPDAPGPH